MSPWVERAKARQLPASDRTGFIRIVVTDDDSEDWDPSELDDTRSSDTYTVLEEDAA